MIKTSLNINVLRTQNHPFHIVDPSPWPLVASLGAFFTVFGLTMYMHFYKNGLLLFTLGLILLVSTMAIWWRDVIREATFEGHHTSYVRKGLKLGMILFIASEVMLFFAFFWSFFNASLNPTVEIGCVWPPKGIVAINPWHVPLLNTIVLVTSGAFITWSHYAILAGYRKDSIESLIYTIILATFFTFLQYFEYCVAPFNISDSVYGSVFYMTTGLHGSHVLIGTIFLSVCLYRLIKHHFTTTHHLGFECGAWYWHFVDIVWIFVYFFIYWWGYPSA
jgi:cytochrome c oxidase subunit 3